MQETRVENNTAPKPGEGQGGRKGKSDVPFFFFYTSWTLGKNPHQTLPGLTRRLLAGQPHAYPREKTSLGAAKQVRRAAKAAKKGVALR